MSRNVLRARSNLLTGATLSLVLLSSSALAQDHDDHDRDHHDRDDRARQHYDHPAYHFRTEDRDRMYAHYRDADRWRDRRDRHEYYEGQRLEGDWRSRMRPIPAQYYRELPPPPPGYRFGYSDGYAVAYNPTTRIVADVIDLAAAGAGR